MTKATDPALEQTAVANTALAATGASGPSAPPGAPEHAAAPGAMIGRYQVESMLGAGGMGVVYVARDPQLDRNVALKVVRSDQFSDEQVRARLSREARAMAKVRHAGVVTVYDAGELPDGVFIAMELVDGTTLARWLAERARPWPEIVRMFVAVGRGLAAAHAAGVVHRDFKPANVLVDASGRPAVTDFGIALVPAGQAADDAAAPGIASAGEAPPPSAMSLTRTGVLAGTPSYMSPEQFRTGAVDARSDQYSFGVALFEALYRVHPFGGNTTEELRIAVMRGVLRLPPRDSTVPVDVRQVVERVLRTDPTERYSDMAALLDALEATLHPRRRRWLLASAAGLAVLAIAGGAYALHRGSEHMPAAAVAPASQPVTAPPHDGAAARDPARRTAVLIAPFANHSGDERLDDTLDLVVGEVLSRSTKLDQASGLSLTRLAQRVGLEPRDIGGIAAKFAQGDPRPVATIAGAIDRDGDALILSAELRAGSNAPVQLSERATGLGDASAAAVKLGAKLAAALGEPLPPAMLDHVMSRSLDALHAYSRGLAMSDGLGGADLLTKAAAEDPTFVEAQADLGTALSSLGREGEAAVQLEMALRNADAMSERRRLMMIGDYNESLGKYDQAIAAYEHLLAKWPGDSRAEIDVSAVAIEAHDWPLALELARHAAADFPTIPVVRANLLLAELGDERIADAAADGSAMVAQLPVPTIFGIAATGIAEELGGQRDAARAAFDRIAKQDPDMAARAAVDLALYEGRLDDAEHELTDWLARGSGDMDRAAEELALARIRVRRGDRAGATAAARAGTRAIAGTRRALDAPIYLIASANVATGDLAQAPAQIRAWSDKPSTDARVFAKLLEGDLALAKRRTADALAAYVAASQIGGSWLVHDRLERGYAATGDHVAAAREAAWCIEHRGEAAIVMTPSLSLLPEMYIARAKELAASGAPAATVAAAYRDAAALAPAAQRDPLTDAARAGSH